MSDIIEQIAGVGQTMGRTCRVAYTLNNTQPVACTIIGDQPLFYMDYAAEDDEEMFDFAELGILEDEINTLRQSIESFDKHYADIIDNEAMESVDAFLENAQSFTKPFKGGTQNSLASIISLLEKSRLASAYMDFASAHKIEITLSAQVETSSYERQSGLIQINPNQSREDMALALVCELRRHWQHRAGALIHPLLFDPDNAILINRAQIADLSIAMIRVAWECQLNDEKSLWDRLEKSPMSDMARAFAREAFLDFRTLNSGIAAAAVFETWFLSERCRAQDKTLIQQMLADYQGYMFDAENNAKSLTADIIAALGSMPYGKNYLAQHAMTIMEDPIFTDVRDRSNANFLWFIKFERSFHETEQELQTSFEPAGPSVHEGHNDKTKVQDHGSEKIITLPGVAQRNAQRDGAKSKQGKRLTSQTDRQSGDNIIDLQSWSQKGA